ncbi:MAG: DUF3486 family protein [Sinobacteraceae bacterium]|nr:DUF3486 family protein [Nevskiaceae bacterium]
MPRRSSILDLPAELKAELDSRLIAAGFSGYAKLEEWLAAQGQWRSKSAIHRYGKPFEERIKALKLATEQARAIVAEAPDDENVVGDALGRLLQEKLFRLLTEIDIDPARVDIHKLGRMIADLARATVAQKRWMAEARAQLAEEVAQKLARAPRKLDADALRLVRQAIRGD